MLTIQMSITIITCFMYKDIINASCNKGMPNHNVETLDKVSPIDISEQLSLYRNIYLNIKIHTRMEDLVMTWNIYIRFKVILRSSVLGLGSGEGFTEIVCIESLLGLSDN